VGNLRDVFFPVKLPPLVLESKPIPVVDRMATKQDPAGDSVCDCHLCDSDPAVRTGSEQAASDRSA